jgi:LmbE family N-acetylglucosaminyl deacetylase
VPAAVPERLRRALDGAGCLVLSAHLDDAVLSCGALLAHLPDATPVTVATVFTEAAPPPHTVAARSFLRQCGAPDAATLFAERRAEDRAVLDELGVAHAHLGVSDALFRARAPLPGSKRIGALVPELAHRYPTYRYDIARGRVSRGDRRLVADLGRRVDDLLVSTGATLLFCPVGIGRHVDHLIVRALGARHPDRVVYYADFPYVTTSPVDTAFLAAHRLAPWDWDAGVPAKARLIRGYRTQADALFPDGRIPVVPETYYVAAG